MREFLEALAVTCISFIIGIVVVILVMLGVKLSLEGNGDIIGTNMKNETKEYVEVIDNFYGITKDGTRELLKSYKYKK